MIASYMPPPEFDELLAAMCDGELTERQAQRLEEIVTGDDDACWHYLCHVHLHGTLHWNGVEKGAGFRGQSPEAVGSGQSAVGSDYLQISKSPNPKSLATSHQPLATNSNPQSLIPNPSAAPTLPSPLSPLSSFATDYPFVFSYIVATLIFGIAGLCGWLYQIEHYTEFARSFGTMPAAVEKAAVVARISGMVDVKWGARKVASGQWLVASDKSLNPEIPKSPVRLGDMLVLASGLLQLTYDSGAEVILQGPCTYEVDSAAGGFLSLGKLTANVGERGEGRGEREGSRSKVQGSRPANQKSEIINQKSLATSHSPLATNSSLFTVKTPAAIITDLGTEFGVDVDKDGVCEVQVLQGRVRAEFFAAAGQPSQIVQLSEGEARRYEPRRNEVAVLPVDRAKFRQMRIVGPLQRWLDYSRELRRDPSLLAYYDFQQKEGQPSVLPNVAGDGDGSLDGVVENATWTDGRMTGKHALLFQSPNDYVSVNLPQKTDDLTLAAWICIDSLDEQPLSGLLMSTGWLQPGQIHWQISKDGYMRFSSPSGSLGCCESPSLIADKRFRRWIHLACVYDHAAGWMRFHVDGQNVSETEYRLSAPIVIGPASIGNWDRATIPEPESRAFRGRMDELVIFGRCLTPGDVRHIYEAGNLQHVSQTPNDAKGGGDKTTKQHP